LRAAELRALEIDSPTPPHPKTATDFPGRTLAVYIAAPRPVATAQPPDAAIASGTSLRATNAALLWDHRMAGKARQAQK